MPLLLILSMAAFVSSLSSRILDPLVPLMARDLNVTVASVALLSSAYTFPYALSQPVIGAIGDQLGKARILKMCLGLLTLALAVAVFAPNYITLLVARVVSGIAGGGIIPVAFAIIGDRVPVADRQSALARVVMASQIAVLMGAPLSGFVGLQLGWRSIFGLAGVAALLAFAELLWVLPAPPKTEKPALSLGLVRAQYAMVWANPLARVVLVAAFVEGMSMFGLLPYVADRLQSRGLGGVWEAGLVLAGLSIGGITYTLLVRHLLRFFGRDGLIRMGGIVACAAMAGIAYSPSWKAEAVFFGILGFGFFSVHNSLQLQATEFAPNARTTALASFAFCFFLGQAISPLLYHAGFTAFGSHAPVITGGIVLLVLAYAVVWQLQHKAADIYAPQRE